MLVKEIKARAQKMGIDPKKMKKAEMIKAIQIREGNNPCFQTMDDSCGQMDCCWRNDCLAM